MKIMIADDDPVSKVYLEKVMQKYGSVHVFTDGVEAVEAFIRAHEKENPYILLMLDVMMPRVDGIKALKTVRELEESRGISDEDRVKVLIVTALEKTSYVMSGLQTENESYLGKPITPSLVDDALLKLKLI